MVISKKEQATVITYNYPCGCSAGVENSDLVRGQRFLDHCGSHQGLPNPAEGRVEYHR